MQAKDITIGGTYVVRIGSRLARVTVERAIHRRHGERQRYQCRTHDTDRTVEATAARLRPAGCAPAPRPVKSAPPAPAPVAEENMGTMPLDRDTYTALAGAAAAGNWSSVDALAAHLDQWIARLPGAGAQAENRAAIVRALLADPAIVTREGWEDIAAAGRVVSSGARLVAPTAVPAVGLVNVNPSRPVEPMVGVNLAIVTRRVGNCHVADSLLAVCRSIRRSMGSHSTRRVPVPLRRGLWQTAASLHAANRAEYRAVMGHAPLPSEEQVTAAMLACR